MRHPDGAQAADRVRSPYENLPDLIGQIVRSGDVPMIGCTTAGEIARYGPRAQRRRRRSRRGRLRPSDTAAAAGRGGIFAGRRPRGHTLPSPAGHPTRVLLLTEGWPATRNESSVARIRAFGAGSRGSALARGRRGLKRQAFQFHGTAC